MVYRKLVLFTTVLVAVSILYVGCSEDDPVPATYSVSGKITYPDFNGTFQNAAGAVVYLVKNTTSASTLYDVATIANASGQYSFTDLDAGDYYLFANYNTENTNLPEGRVIGINFGSGDGNLFSIVDADYALDLPLTEIGTSGNVLINTFNSDWNFDMVHSRVTFSFPFDEVNAEFNGVFDVYDMDINFDEANPANTTIEASVTITSADTGQPGRDRLGGCLLSYLGIAYDPADTVDGGGPNPELDPNTGIPVSVIPTTAYSTFESTSVQRYGDGYLAKGDLSFRGTTKSVNLFFKYIVGYIKGTAPSQTQISSFEGYFTFAGKADFGVDSSHLLNGDVRVDISMEVNKAIE